MELSHLLVCLVVVAVWAVVAAATADVPAASPKPDCPPSETCGGTEVPFPFALKRGCAITKQFQLNCTTTTAGGTKVLLHDDGHGNKLEVTKINVTDNKVRVNTRISRRCYNYNQSSMEMITDEAWMNITSMPYTLSHKDNTVVVLGCPISSAYMTGRTVSNLLNL